ncbi:MAG: acid phosphatase [Candidatus Marinimicrobia bacterium]|nr:acid phosphatase [Candidatus Neomarinimicrobiota bacterium]
MSAGNRFKGILSTLGLLVAFQGCGGQQSPAYTQLDGTLWMQQSAEYWSITTQTYRAARQQLDRALGDRKWTAALEQSGDYGQLPPAVILDVDDTVLESTTYTAQRLLAGDNYTYDTWKVYIEEHGSRPIPGALEFCLYAASKGVSIFYVTNNREELTRPIAAALRSHGFPVADDDSNVLTRTAERDKSARRELVAAGHRVLLLLGDDGNDFAPDLGNGTRDERAAAARKHADRWGRSWFVLPNPMYGSWQSALYSDAAPEGMQETVEAKLNSLDLK